jgi:hypothetical protein
MKPTHWCALDTVEDKWKDHIISEMRVTHFEVLGILDIAEDGVIQLVESEPTKALDVHDVDFFRVESLIC